MAPPRLAYSDDLATVWHGDALDVLAKLPDASVHAAIVDPPYGLAKQSPKLVADVLARWVGGERSYVPGGTGLNGAHWDVFVPPPALWDEVLRVLKPGGHLLCFAAPRTQDIMGISVRLAGVRAQARRPHMPSRDHRVLGGSSKPLREPQRVKSPGVVRDACCMFFDRP